MPIDTDTTPSIAWSSEQEEALTTLQDSLRKKYQEISDGAAGPRTEDLLRVGLEPFEGELHRLFETSIYQLCH
jgi:hypothetical protein